VLVDLAVRAPDPLAAAAVLSCGLAEAGVLMIAGNINGRLDATLGPDSTKLTVFAMLALGLCALVWRSITRGAHYSVCAQITRSLVRPLARPDPWKRSVGGPGGPRYPIEVGDGDGTASRCSAASNDEIGSNCRHFAP